MKNTCEYLDAAKLILRIDSDRELSRKLEFNSSRMGEYRAKRLFLNNHDAMKIAEVLKLNPLVVIADSEAERAKNADEKVYWIAAAKKFAAIGTAALLLIAIGSPNFSTTNQTNRAGDSDHFILC